MPRCLVPRIPPWPLYLPAKMRQRLAAVGAAAVKNSVSLLEDRHWIESVHDLDLKDGKYGRAEAAGARMMLDGLMSRTGNDDERIERAPVIFDDRHEALGTRKRDLE